MIWVLMGKEIEPYGDSTTSDGIALAKLFILSVFSFVKKGNIEIASTFWAVVRIRNLPALFLLKVW